MSSFYEGDIKLTEEQRMNNVVFGDPEGSSTRAATNDEKIKWPNGVIPYEFDCSVGTCPFVVQRISMEKLFPIFLSIVSNLCA